MVIEGPKLYSVLYKCVKRLRRFPDAAQWTLGRGIMLPTYLRLPIRTQNQ
jgi:hypothetical protein